MEDMRVLMPAEPTTEPTTEPTQGHLTRWVHVGLGLVVALTATVLLAISLTGLDFLGENDEPGPGFFPALVSGILVVLGTALAVVWLLSSRARRGEMTELSLERAHLIRAMTVWVLLAGFAAVIEPLGFLVAGELFVLVLLLFVDRIRTPGLAVTLLLLPPATYFLFATLLEVQLPTGELWS
jgi:Tripartite tricarboxylate transporter TctB family